MITEDRLRQNVHEIADLQTPAPGAWNRFQARRRRATIRRIGLSALAASLAAHATPDTDGTDA